MKKYINLNKENIEAYTPKYAVDLIIPFLDKKKVIWAPFSLNRHNFADYLRRKGFKVISSHITEGKNFFEFKPKEHYDLILDNPPFKGKTNFVKRAIELKKPFAFFLPINSLGDNGIPSLFIENNLRMELLIPDKRTEFHNQKQTGISFKTVYICNKILPEQIIFRKIKKVGLNEEQRDNKKL